jgi:hypothetical protein
MFVSVSALQREYDGIPQRNFNGQGSASPSKHASDCRQQQRRLQKVPEIRRRMEMFMAVLAISDGRHSDENKSNNILAARCRAGG